MRGNVTNFDIDTTGVHKIKSSKQNTMGEYAVVRKDEVTEYSVRSYMKYKDVNGDVRVVYSDVRTVDMND